MVVNIIMHFSLIFTQVNTKHKTPLVSKKNNNKNRGKKNFVYFKLLELYGIGQKEISNQSTINKVKFKMFKIKLAVALNMNFYSEIGYH